MSSSSDENKYTFSHKHRGLAVIIVNKKFPNMKTRRGSKQDLKMMKALFQSLDFTVKCYKNLSSKKMFEKLTKASLSPMNTNSDCFACVISTHGSEELDINLTKKNKTPQIWQHVLCGSDGGGVYANEIIQLFDETVCDSLKGKPKLFFLQACRSRPGREKDGYDFGCCVKVYENGPTKDNGESSDMKDEMDKTLAAIRPTFRSGCSENMTDVQEEKDDDEWQSDLDTDSDDSDDGEDELDVKHSQDSGDIPKPPVEIVPITCPNDCLIMHPIVSGKMAFRNTGKGSWMLYYLYKEMKELISSGDLLPFLTRVSQRMALEYKFDPDPEEYPKNFSPDLVAQLPFKMAACITHRLTRDIYFEPKEKHSIMWTMFQRFK